MRFTVMARMVFDNTHALNPDWGTDVLAELRMRMATFYDAGRVAPSANSPPEKPISMAAWVANPCMSVYGVSAIIMTVSELADAIGGPGSVIGIPFDWDRINGNGLFCTAGNQLNEIQGMISVPRFQCRRNAPLGRSNRYR